jgi:hypothetical protein
LSRYNKVLKQGPLFNVRPSPEYYIVKIFKIENKCKVCIENSEISRGRTLGFRAEL